MKWVYLLLTWVWGLEATRLPNGTDLLTGERYGPKVHTINNKDPYAGVSIEEGNGRYPVIFEPLQNVQTSRSTFKVTSFIDFTPYLEYFHSFEQHLAAFRASIDSLEEDAVMNEYRDAVYRAAGSKGEKECTHYAYCFAQPLLFKVVNEQARAQALRRQREICMSKQMQACLLLRQFEYIKNATDLVNDNYLQVKDKFLKAIDYIEGTGVQVSSGGESENRKKRSIWRNKLSGLTHEERNYLKDQLVRLAEWEPGQNETDRVKRWVSIFTSIGSAIGSLINAGQIKKIKQNIKILQEATLLQEQKIGELARYADLTASRVRLHDSQIYELQYRLLIVEDGIKEMIDVSNFQIYTTYQVNVAQILLSRLQMGVIGIEGNVDKIFEYLRIMTSHWATSAVIPPMALRRLLRKIQDRMRSNPRLTLPYDPETKDIWGYYGVIKVVPMVVDKLLIVLMTIPILDKSLELNVYRVHNLPASPLDRILGPEQQVAATYQLEGEYFAIGKHGVYVTVLTETTVKVCLESGLAVCMMGQALYPAKQVTWCVYALFIANEGRIRRDCKYNLESVVSNRAISLGGYLWAVSSVTHEQIQVRCLEETHVIEIRPPLQIIYMGNGCEGYSPSMFIPAKTEMSVQMELENRKDYFLKFNFVFTPDRLIGVWWQFCSKLMNSEQAKSLIERVKPLGTIDYRLINRPVPTIQTDYGISLPVPPTTIVIGGIVLVLTVGIVILGCYVYRIRKTIKPWGETVKHVANKPVSEARSLLSRIRRRFQKKSTPVLRTSSPKASIKAETPPTGIHPIRMTKILREVFPDGQTAHRYAKHLDTKNREVQTNSQDTSSIPHETASATSVEIEESQF